MHLIVEIVLAAVLICTLTLLWRLSGKIFFTPVPKAPGITAYLAISASGDADGLEEIVSSLNWLKDTVRLGGEIVLIDAGLTEKGKYTARLLAQEGRNITVEEFPKINAC